MFWKAFKITFGIVAGLLAIPVAVGLVIWGVCAAAEYYNAWSETPQGAALEAFKAGHPIIFWICVAISPFAALSIIDDMKTGWDNWIADLQRLGRNGVKLRTPDADASD